MRVGCLEGRRGALELKRRTWKDDWFRKNALGGQRTGAWEGFITYLEHMKISCRVQGGSGRIG